MRFAAALLLLLRNDFSSAFISPKIASNYAAVIQRRTGSPCVSQSCAAKRKDVVIRNMYSLPPSGGNNNNNNNDNGLQEIIYGVGSILALGLFFASPLGGIFFAITNSLLVLAFLLPFVGYVGFQIWQSINIVQAPCPNCGAPCSALKNGEQPSLCLNCGAVVEASSDGQSIELQQQDVVVDEGYSTGSIFDSLFGNMDPMMDDEITTVSTTKTTTVQDKESQYRRKNTVIDVDVTRD